ncbi:hypothetical protein E6Q11_02700 [Candidatus Dojkabacteria bacterium]|uniref:Uncharacterized protein n=1 Tax=Candidatus Dojkabacteria bacterium TaxID=2099670 RepID=A0A5C7J921_9BACT|nr:MAG: hypothetical protein E6Q11_02700 [Candidatus Dojkabacteria bacterium]
MSNNRDAQGRLLPGHSSPGPGRPTREKELAILDTIKAEATPEKVKAVLQKLHEQAVEHGSVKAAQLWLAYVAGKPQEAEAQPASGYDFSRSLFKRIAELEAQVNAKTIEGESV